MNKNLKNKKKIPKDEVIVAAHPFPFISKISKEVVHVHFKCTWDNSHKVDI